MTTEENFRKMLVAGGLTLAVHKLRKTSKCDAEDEQMPEEADSKIKGWHHDHLIAKQGWRKS